MNALVPGSPLSRIARRAEALARRAVELTPMPQPPWRPTRLPVVLMHGFGALANAAQGGVLHAEALALRQRGVAAYAPHVNPYDTLSVRAGAWADRIARVLDETGADRVHLIGFSSGGLDARVLLSEMDWAPRVASLVTVATPHRGTDLARFILDRPDRQRTALVGAMDFFGRVAYETVPPHAADAIAELTPHAAEARFSDETVPGVWCASFASRAGKGARALMHPALVVPNRILYALGGLNDGIVPTASMAWGERLGTLDADHARLIGLTVAPSPLFESRAFYSSVCDRLIEKEEEG